MWWIFKIYPTLELEPKISNLFEKVMIARAEKVAVFKAFLFSMCRVFSDSIIGFIFFLPRDNVPEVTDFRK
jgi:hypothetical protein